VAAPQDVERRSLGESQPPGTAATRSTSRPGNEGVWQVDAFQSQPLNRAFTDSRGSVNRQDRFSPEASLSIY
jgi:hypothetical protein